MDGTAEKKTIAHMTGIDNARHEATGLARFPVLDTSVLAHFTVGDGHLCDVVKHYLRDGRVREAIFMASPALYEKTCAWERGVGSFNAIQIALARYIIRMAYRATPFGAFSYVVPFRTNGETTSLHVESNDLRRHVELDSDSLARIASELGTSPTGNATLLVRPNDTIYRNGGIIRFFAYSRRKSGRRSYRQVEIENDSAVDLVLTLSSNGIRPNELAELLVPTQDVPFSEALDYVHQLIDSQLLCIDSLLSVTSGNPLKHMLNQLSPNTPGFEEINDLANIVSTMVDAKHPDFIEYAKAANDKLIKLSIIPDKGQALKVDLHAQKDCAGHLDSQVVERINEVIEQFGSFYRTTHLDTFCQSFDRRFGDGEVPLLALVEDFESMGFGTHHVQTNSLVKAVGRSSGVHGLGTSTDSLESFIQSSVASSLSNYRELPSSGNHKATPVSGQQPIVAWLSLWRSAAPNADLVELRRAACMEPGRLMGRFSTGSGKIRNMLRGESNQRDFEIAELVHLPEDRLGNIVSRANLSDYEIPIRTGISNNAKCLSLSDLHVSVHDNRVIIRSLRLNKRIEIRMSNAHAFDKKESLPVYRFLNAVANQGGTLQLPDLRTKFPTAPFLPGLLANGVIVSRPTWLIDRSASSRMSKLGSPERRELIEEIRCTFGMPTWVALVQGDNVLPYNLDTEWMVDDLIKQIIKQGFGTLTDAFPDNRTPAIESQGRAYAHELQVVLPPALACVGLPRADRTPNKATVEHIWGEWCYLKLYCVPTKQNYVLSSLDDVLAPLVKEGRIRGYFFVRYRDDIGPHLRIRVRSFEGGSGAILLHLKETLIQLTNEGSVMEIVMAPYVREVTRYGGLECLSYCEDIFCADTSAIIRALKDPRLDSIDAWRIGAVAADSYLRALGFADMGSRLDFARRASADFALEQNLTSNQRKNIGAIFRNSKNLFDVDGSPLDTSDAPQYFSETDPSIETIWRAMPEMSPPMTSERRYALCWDLLHMRFNRLFKADARLQEAIVWDLLRRSYLKALAITSSRGTNEI